MKINDNIQYKKENDNVGTPTDKMIMDLELKLNQAMVRFCIANQNANYMDMSDAFKEAREIQKMLDYLYPIQMKERGLSYITDFGKECYSIEELKRWNNWYNKISEENKKIFKY